MIELERDIGRALIALNVVRIVAFVGAVILVGAVLLLTSTRAAEHHDAALERMIASGTREAATLRARARTLHPTSEKLIANAAVQETRYRAARREIAIDVPTSTVSGAGFTRVAIPPQVIQVILACDTLVTVARAAIDTTRAGWMFERAAADTQLVVDSLKDQRPAPSRCGFKCGVAVGAAGTTVVIAAAVKLIRAIVPRASNLSPSRRL